MTSMAAKTIVTLHPDVECDVCGRRLLRGERPDVFLGGGQRHMVCELCTPRAAHEGWRREIEGQGAAGARGQRPQRGRSLLGRLRQLREPGRAADLPAAEAVAAEQIGGLDPQAPRRPRTRGRAAEWSGIEPEWTSIDEEWAELNQEQAEPTATDEPVVAEPAGAVEARVGRGDENVRRALEIFNGGETPRRIAGIARALGEVCVNVARVPGRESVVAIVVAWELCWYRYEIDLDDALGEVRIAAEGMELAEVPAEDCVANATADEHGMLSLLSA